MYLGNITFNQVEEELGYQLTEEDKLLWDKFHNNNAELKGRDSCFHIFYLPCCIMFKGEEAKQAILKMFTPDKITQSKGTFEVLEYTEN